MPVCCSGPTFYPLHLPSYCVRCLLPAMSTSTADLFFTSSHHHNHHRRHQHSEAAIMSRRSIFGSVRDKLSRKSSGLSSHSTEESRPQTQAFRGPTELNNGAAAVSGPAFNSNPFSNPSQPTRRPRKPKSHTPVTRMVVRTELTTFQEMILPQLTARARPRPRAPPSRRARHTRLATRHPRHPPTRGSVPLLRRTRMRSSRASTPYS